MFIIINSGMADDGETFVDVVGKPMYDLEEAKTEFRKFITESYFPDEPPLPLDYCFDDDGIYVDFQTCIYTESSDGYTHIELKSIRT